MATVLGEVRVVRISTLEESRGSSHCQRGVFHNFITPGFRESPWARTYGHFRRPEGVRRPY